MARSILTELPRFIPPMLAKSGVPFDSQEHLFELKWDGTRALAFVDANRYRLVNRHRADVTERYPEFGFLNDLPTGIVLDGEVVSLMGQKPPHSNAVKRILRVLTALFGLDLKPAARRFAVAESLSHLERLVAEGGAVKSGADGPISYTPA